MTRTEALSVGQALTPAELRILYGYSFGKTDQEIGEIQGISVNTVKSHGVRLRLKLHARDRAHAVGAAFRSGIMKPPRDAENPPTPGVTQV